MRARWQRLPVWQRALLLVSAWLVGFLLLGPALSSLFGPLVEPWNWVALGGFVVTSVMAAWLPGRRRRRDEVSR
jgi:membrane associated rhomboid family serine protease